MSNNIPKKPPLDELTPEQQALLPVFAKRWEEIALNTAPANREAAIAGIKHAYPNRGLAEVQFVSYSSSPAALILTFLGCDALEKGMEMTDIVNVGFPLLVAYTELGNFKQLESEAVNNMLDFLQHLKNTNQMPKTKVTRDKAEETFKAIVQAFPWQFGYGQHDANWLAFYEFFREACGLVEETKSLEGIWEVAKNSGWYIPALNDAGTEGRVFMCERQQALHLDDRGRPHNTNGPAFLCRDGFKQYYIAGIEIVGRDYVVENPAQITVKEIEEESNIEVRRVLIDQYESEKAGREKGAFLMDSGAKEIQRDDYGVLYRKEIPGDEPYVAVAVVNSTPEPDGTHKTYILRVPPDTKTAHQAVAWSFDLTPEQYAPEVQT